MTVVNDDTGQAVVDVSDDTITRAIGAELRRARSKAGWSRPELIKRMRTPVPVNTYACYEQGIRQCSIPRLVEICRALGVSVPELIGLALQRIEHDLENADVSIDLRKVVHDERDELELLRRWARNRINRNTTTADSRESAVVRLQSAVVKEMAIFCGFPAKRLMGYLREFAPESALQR